MREQARPPRNVVELGVGMRQNPQARNNSLNDVIDLTREFANVGLRQSPAERRARAANEESFFEDERRARAAEDRARAAEDRARAAERHDAERIDAERRELARYAALHEHRRATPNYSELNRRLNEDDGAIGATARQGSSSSSMIFERSNSRDAAEDYAKRRVIERAKELYMIVGELEAGRMHISPAQRKKLEDEIDKLYISNEILRDRCTTMFGRRAKKHRRRLRAKKRRSTKKRR